jgi:phospholipid/cholesterol/gamma-HCH transport system permease protein
MAASSNPYRSGPNLLGRVGAESRERLVHAGEMGTLAAKSVRASVRPPFDWLPEMVHQLSLAVRRCLIPMVVSVGTFTFAFAIVVFGVLLEDLGATDRHPGGAFIALIREVCVWITTMVFAGAAGSAVCADLGARKVREELDALDVMGLDRMRAIVVPRVVGLTLAAPVLGMLALLFAQLLSYALSPPLVGYSTGIWWDGVSSSVLPLDVYAAIVKYLLIGFFVAVVACHKGMASRGGTRGVGLAVNQTVVLTFLGIWIINSFFNLAFLTLFPDASVVRG